MATTRVDITTSAPSTELYTQADLISQDQAGNYSTDYYWVGAINRGGTSSFSNYAGYQVAYIGGAGGSGHSGTLPSGYAAGAQRWFDGPWGVNLGHDAAGNRGSDTVQQNVHGWFGSTTADRNDYGSIGPYPRIPKAPSQPGTPVASHVLPTSLQLDWAASTDNAGSAIDGYLVRRWLGTTMTGTYTDVSQTNTLTRNDSGLTPGTNYTYGIYAHNGSAAGYSLVSSPVTVKTLAPAHVKVGGVWKYGVPYLKIAGVWTVGLPFVKVAGIWKATG